MQSEPNLPWYRELNRYHWFVLIVCTLGWLFDCLDQQLFNISRAQAMRDLIPPDGNPDTWAGWATAMLLIGWATGGIVFGIMGDRVGRAKTMVWTILAYSVFTGLSAFSFSVWDFILYRFMTGLGVGGQFAVGVSLVAEVMPSRARPRALGALQAFSAVGNITAGMIGMGFSMLFLEEVVGSYWRWMFAIGVLPALLAVVVMARLQEPRQWQEQVAEKGKRGAGSLAEMFGTPQWRRRAIVGVILGSAGQIGLWAIGVFSNDLIGSIFRKDYQNQARAEGAAENDRLFVRTVLEHPEALTRAIDRFAEKTVLPRDLLGLQPGNKDPEALYAAAVALRKAGKDVSPAAVLDHLDRGNGAAAQSSQDRVRREEYLAVPPPPAAEVGPLLDKIVARHIHITGNVGIWTSVNLLLFNVGAFLGIYAFSIVTQSLGRRPTFAIFFVLAGACTVAAFAFLNDKSDIFWMTPIMGAAQLSVFGGYAIYFPELFPTRMRATGTSVCYNIARYAAATGPVGTGFLTGYVFAHHAEPLRYAGAWMCLVYVLGLLVLPFAPETKDQPLPE